MMGIHVWALLIFAVVFLPLIVWRLICINEDARLQKMREDFELHIYDRKKKEATRYKE